MLKITFNNETEILLSNDNDINIIQDRNPITGNLFQDKQEALEWAKIYADSIGEVLYTEIELLRDEKKKLISGQCKAILNGGFKSSAYQGIEKLYNSTNEDQNNIRGNILAVMTKRSGEADCQDDKFYYHATNEDFIEWTEDEVLKLGRDLKKFIEYNLFRSKAIQNFIDTLEDKSSLESIVSWNNVDIDEKGVAHFVN